MLVSSASDVSSQSQHIAGENGAVSTLVSADPLTFVIFLAGQRKLSQSSILVVGAGGLGSPLALYLAACGVGNFLLRC